jgi:hypothetical protein
MLIWSGNVDMVRTLINNGANVQARLISGRWGFLPGCNAVQFARRTCGEPRDQMLSMLQAAGADMSPHISDNVPHSSSR